MSFVLAALSLGFLGSFHCIGMCGPIALALPVHGKSQSHKIFSILAYNFGRIFTYALLGIVFGLIGQSFAIFGFQQKLSVVLGVLILAGVLLPQRFFSRSKLAVKFYSFFNKLKSSMAAQFREKGIKSLFSIGLLNGLLPCGMVYIAIAGAVATSSVFEGSLFMAAFGAGTLPFMFAISYTSHLITVKARNVIRKAMPIMVGIMAVLLILRGLNLGINHLSPKITEECSVVNATGHKEINCCPKK